MRDPQTQGRGVLLMILFWCAASAAAVCAATQNWTVITTDRKPSAHYEHVVLVTPDEPEVLTLRKRMFPKGIQDLTPLPVSEL